MSFMKSFADIPISRKLMLITLSTSVAAVFIASIAFATSEAFNYRESTVSDIATLGDVIGITSTAAIIFEDEQLADQVLSSLDADPMVINASMYTASNLLLAHYDAVEHSHEDPSTHAYVKELVTEAFDTMAPIEQFDGLRYLDSVRPIYFDGELIGFIHLRASLENLTATLQRIALMALLIIGIAIVFAYLLSVRLQSLISGPIIDLLALMKAVTERDDYSLRAESKSQDEIGVLMNGFNEMLEQVSSRDVKLADANNKLKFAVRETLKAKEDAESASKAKSDFLARMSHEIRTPMNGVLGMTELLLASELGERQQKFAETIQHSGEALLEVINDVLDFSKIEAGKLTLEETGIDLADVVESIVDLLYSRAQKNDVELIAAIEPNVQTLARGDAFRLRQVLMNLVSNAIKFTHDGEVVISLSQPDPKERLFRFEVSDTGIGIDLEQVELIFDSFAQADGSTTRRYGGTGLGLAICKQLVELMGGEIGVKSEPGQGSAFWFTLPLAEERRSAPQDSQLSSLDGMKVLTVCDNQTRLDTYGKQLASWRAGCVSVRSTEEAIELIRQHADPASIDIVLIDIARSGGSVESLVSEIRHIPNMIRTRVLALSASPAQSHALESMSRLDLSLPKPIRKAMLHRSLGELWRDTNTPRRPQEDSTTAGETDNQQFDLKVLLAEDNPVNMMVAKHMMTGLGCEVIESVNGEDALEAIARTSPDIVFMDCQMPVLDGYSATRAQRAREEKLGERHLPIVALTANALRGDREKCLEAGMDEFISKPFGRKDIVEVFARLGFEPGRTASSASAIGSVVAGADENSVIDADAIEQLRAVAFDNEGFLEQLIDKYVDSAPALFHEMATGVESDNLEQAMHAAHSLKSSSVNMGANRLSKHCAAIEQAARNGDVSNVDSIVDTARTELDDAIAQLLAMKNRAA